MESESLPTVIAIPPLFVQVFQNLVSNAIRFAGDEPLKIRIGAQRDEKEWTFFVKDNGIGIEPPYFDRIFRIFQRIDSSPDRPGTGIGLANCKKIVERHGGRIWVESQPGKGSTFFFTIPHRGPRTLNGNRTRTETMAPDESCHSGNLGVQRHKVLRRRGGAQDRRTVQIQRRQSMSKIREIKEAIGTKLDKWEAGATAVEAQLQQTKEQALEGLEARKKQLNETLKEFKSEVAKAKGLADEKKTEIQAQFEDLQVQLALGKAEARDAFEAQKEKIQRSIATLETTIDRELDAAGQSIDESLKKAANKFIVAALRLEAEMEALGVQLEVKKAGARAQFEHKKRELVAQIKRVQRPTRGNEANGQGQSCNL